MNAVAFKFNRRKSRTGRIDEAVWKPVISVMELSTSSGFRAGKGGSAQLVFANQKIRLFQSFSTAVRESSPDPESPELPSPEANSINEQIREISKEIKTKSRQNPHPSGIGVVGNVLASRIPRVLRGLRALTETGSAWAAQLRRCIWNVPETRMNQISLQQLISSRNLTRLPGKGQVCPPLPRL